MSALIIPVAFVVGALCGGGLIWHWRAKKGEDGGMPRGQKWKLVVATALSTIVFVGAAGYGILRYRFRKTKVSGASEKDALADFRKKNKKGAADGPADMPPEGVYRYRGSGGYGAALPLLGEERRNLPKFVPATVVRQGRCYTVTLRYFAQHHWTAHYCRLPGNGLSRPWYKDRNIAFNQKRLEHRTCPTATLYGPKKPPGTSWEQRCDRVGPKPLFALDRKIKATHVGLVPLQIGKRKVMAHLVRRNIRVDGAMGTGDFVRDVYFHAKTGMLLKISSTGKAGGAAKLDSNFEVVLDDLTPRR